MMLTPRGYLFFCVRTTKKVPSLVYYNDRLFLSSISNDPGRETRLVQGCSFPMPMNNVAMPTARLLPPLPVGNSSFERLREDKQLYVDKTDLIYQLASRSEKFFLTRPRRFGKSLLVSTFASLFSHGLRYFSGLAIEKLWHDKIYHVVRIDFSEIKDFKTAAEFACQFYDKLQWWFRPAGFRYDATLPGDVITQLSAWIKTLPVSSLVILIDEYDAPLTDSLNDRTLFDDVRNKLTQFYAVIKANDDCVRFMFITGIAKFNQTGIFSALNNFSDISLYKNFGTLLGYSETDLDRWFKGYEDQAAKALNLTREDVRSRLRANYDGYCFDGQASTRVYNPWSVLRFFSWPDEGFSNYWMTSGGKPNVLQKYLLSHSLQSPADYATTKELPYSALDASSDFDTIDDVALLTQAGYLTIKRRRGRYFQVGYPNQEVADALAELYSDLLLQERSYDDVGAGDLVDAVHAGNVDQFFGSANQAFAAIDYTRYPVTNEKSCQAFLQIFILGAGFDVTAENHSALGRSDLEIKTAEHHWVIELKYLPKGQGTADAFLADAVKQMKDRRYGTSAKVPPLRVAAVFSAETRSFVAWKAVD